MRKSRLDGSHPDRDGVGRRRFLGGAAFAAGLFLLAGSRSNSQGESLSELVTRCRFGAYASNTPYPEQPLFDLERAVGHKLPISSWFISWGSSWATEAASVLQEKGGYDILCCWEAHGVRFSDILSGAKDDVIKSFVQGASTYTGGTVYVRLFHEYNGSWYDWTDMSGRGYCTSAAQWKQAYQHVVTVARTVSTKVKFMFCATAPLTKADFDNYYPGDSFCDIVGTDSYGGSGFSGTSSADDGFESTYTVIAAGSAHPVWVGETGYRGSDAEAAKYAASWYANRKYPRLVAVAWFVNKDFPFGPLQTAVHKAQLGLMPASPTPARSPRPAQ